MGDSDNKAELFLMITSSISQIRDVPTSFIATIKGKVISNGLDIDFEDIMPCNQEESDTRFILHIFNRFKKARQKIP